MVGESQRRRICKYCNKSFPSGKSLGGHVRSHVMGCGLTQNPKKIRRLSDVDDRVQMELQDVAVVLMMLSRDDASAGAAAAEESSSRNSGVVEECEQYEEDWDMSRRRRRRRKSRPAGHPTDRDFSYGGDHWEEAAVELIGNKNGGPKGRRGSDDWYEPEKTQNSKRSRFRCNTCKKVFCTYQALGGHRAAHKRTKGPCYVPDADANEDEEGNHEVKVEAQISGAHAPPDRKAIRYQCPACLKVFASGQALGGHKRSHVAVNCSDAEATDILFDLNAPALGDGNSSITNAQAGTVPCLVGRNSTAECPAGVVGEGK